MENKDEYAYPPKTDIGQAKADLGADVANLADRVKSEASQAGEAITGAKDEVMRKAGEFAEQAKQTATKQAETAQRGVADSLNAFSGALRAASDHLGGAQQGMAAKYIGDAAGGLESLSGALRDKHIGDILGEVRNFGRNNSGALIAGAVLAGVALGRFLKASTPQPQTYAGGNDDLYGSPYDSDFDRTGTDPFASETFAGEDSLYADNLARTSAFAGSTVSSEFDAMTDDDLLAGDISRTGDETFGADRTGDPFAVDAVDVTLEEDIDDPLSGGVRERGPNL